MEREKELAKEVRAMQDNLTRARRAAGGEGYGSNEVRQINTRRLRAEYAHAEVKREIERRKAGGDWVPEPDIATLAAAAATTARAATAGSAAAAPSAPPAPFAAFAATPFLAAEASKRHAKGRPGASSHRSGSLLPTGMMGSGALASETPAGFQCSPLAMSVGPGRPAGTSPTAVAAGLVES